MKKASHILPLTGIVCLAFTASPAHAAVLVFDDFTSYTNGNLDGQTGGASPIGFEAGAWASQAAAQTTVTTANGGVVTSSLNALRTSRAVTPNITPTIPTGIVFIRTRLAFSNTAPGSTQLLEFSTAELNGDTNAVRLAGGSTFSVNVTGGGTGTGSLGTNDGLFHEWLIQMDLGGGGTSKVWLDPIIASFNPAVGGTTFTPSAAFSINAINLGVFRAGSENTSLSVDAIRIGNTLSDIGVTVIPEPSAALLGGLGLLALLRRRR